MAPRDLKVDTTALASEGQGLVGAAGDIPDPPPPFTTTGDDPLSQALRANQQAAEAPLIDGLPGTKQGAQRDAQSVVTAAGMYDKTDHEKAAEFAQHPFDSAGSATGPGGVGAGGAGGVPGGGAPGMQTATSGTSAGGSQMGGMDQMGQMMQMPMQMASQLGQIPMQMGGMLGSLPQTLMQTMQSAMQQGSKASQLAGKTDAKDDGKEAQAAKLVDDKKSEEKPEPDDREKPDAHQGAAGAQPHHGHAPTGQPQPGAAEKAPDRQAPVAPRPTTPTTPQNPEPYSVL